MSETITLDQLQVGDVFEFLGDGPARVTRIEYVEAENDTMIFFEYVYGSDGGSWYRTDEDCELIERPGPTDTLDEIDAIVAAIERERLSANTPS